MAGHTDFLNYLTLCAEHDKKLADMSWHEAQGHDEPSICCLLSTSIGSTDPVHGLSILSTKQDCCDELVQLAASMHACSHACAIRTAAVSGILLRAVNSVEVHCRSQM